MLYSEAEGGAEALAEQLGIPVAETFAGKGAVQQRRVVAAGRRRPGGQPGGQRAGPRGGPRAHRRHPADGLHDRLAVGVRRTRTCASPAINVVARDARKQGATPMLADAKLALEALRRRGRRRGAARRRGASSAAAKQAWRRSAPPRSTRTGRRHRALPATPTSVPTPTRVLTQALLHEYAQPGDTIIAAAGGPPGDLLKVWDATGGRHCHLEFGFSCMGYEMPAALGVRLAADRRRGDRAARRRHVPDGADRARTAAQEGLKVTVVVSDNHGYQVIRRLQMGTTGREFGNEMRYREARSSSEAGKPAVDGDYVRLDLVQVARRARCPRLPRRHARRGPRGARGTRDRAAGRSSSWSRAPARRPAGRRRVVGRRARRGVRVGHRELGRARLRGRPRDAAVARMSP